VSDLVPSAPKRFLIVCVENGNRSQMAEAFARLHGGGFWAAAGIFWRPTGAGRRSILFLLKE
jgi:protein-tyrosine-phosphatase